MTTLITMLCVGSVWLFYYNDPGIFTSIWYYYIIICCLALLIKAKIFSEEFFGNTTVQDIEDSKEFIFSNSVIISITSINVGLVLMLTNHLILGLLTILLAIYTLFYINISDKFKNKANKIIKNKQEIK